MAAIPLRFDRDATIQKLQARGVDAAYAEAFADVLAEDIVDPANRGFAAKTGEASARGKMTGRINQALDQITNLVTRVTNIEDKVGRIERRLETEMATKKDLTELENRMLMKFGLIVTVGITTLLALQGGALALFQLVK